MIEPTETESKETLDAFAAVLLRIAGEDAEFLHDAPHALEISRPDEVKAAKEPTGALESRNCQLSSSKSEIRNPKPETNAKHQSRKSKIRLLVGPEHFGFRIF